MSFATALCMLITYCDNIENLHSPALTAVHPSIENFYILESYQN